MEALWLPKLAEDGGTQQIGLEVGLGQVEEGPLEC